MPKIQLIQLTVGKGGLDPIPALFTGANESVLIIVIAELWEHGDITGLEM